MKKLIFFLVMFLLYSCETQKFEENESITKYTLNKYETILKEDNVKFLKCWPKKDGGMNVVYTTFERDNSFPATIRLNYLNKSYNVYFDTAYLNGDKQLLLNDIDECIEYWKKLKDSKKTWK